MQRQRLTKKLCEHEFFAMKSLYLIYYKLTFSDAKVLELNLRTRYVAFYKILNKIINMFFVKSIILGMQTVKNE